MKATGVSFSTCRMRFLFVTPLAIAMMLSGGRNKKYIWLFKTVKVVRRFTGSVYKTEYSILG